MSNGNNNTRNVKHVNLNDQNTAFENNYFTEMCSGSEAGSFSRLIDFCITQLQA